MADENVAMARELDEMMDMIDEPESEPEADVVETETETEVESEPEVDDESQPETEAVEEEPESESEEQYVEEPDDERADFVDDDDSGVVAEESGSDVEALRAQNEALLKHIEELSGQVIGGVMYPQVGQQDADPKDTSQGKAQDQAPADPTNFLGELSIDDLLEDPAKFNAVLNNVAQSSQAVAKQQAVQQVLRSVPELVMGYITRHSAMNRMVDDFYKENVDLVSVKQTVAAVANDVHAKNPGLSVEEVFKQSAEATRKLLGLKRDAANAVKRQPKKPAFAKAGGARKPAPKVSAVQREIDNLLNGEF